jgi:hypothetical protein
VIGVHLLLKEQVKTMINAINADCGKNGRKSGISSIHLCIFSCVFH